MCWIHRLKRTSSSKYKHTLKNNSYISDSFKFMARENKLTNKNIYSHIFLLTRYVFVDVKVDKCKTLSDRLYNYIINEHKNDFELSYVVYEWYKNLLDTDKDGFPMSNSEYNMGKIKEMASLITPPKLERNKHNYLVDVGAGDCALTFIMGNYSLMKPIAVDIKDEIDWGSASEKSMCSNVRHIFYDGSNLYKSVKGKIGKEHVGMVMYNHSLHHFGSLENIEKSLTQAYKLLTNGGILFIREHDNYNNDIDINLQHIFISLRYTIDHYPKWDMNMLWNYMENFIKTYSSNFFSKKHLIDLCRTIGFKLIKAEKRKSYNYEHYKDISKTTLYAFEKI